MKLRLPVLAALLAGAISAQADLAAITNIYMDFGYGLTVGTNVSVTKPGTIRWSPSASNLQAHTGAAWTDVGAVSAETVSNAVSAWLAANPPSYSESDPVFAASAAAGVSTSSMSNWNVAFGWGNHATHGYLTEETYLGTIVGGTIATGASPSVVTNDGILQFTIPAGVGGTNAAGLEAITNDFTISKTFEVDDGIFETNSALVSMDYDGLHISGSALKIDGDSLWVDGMKPLRGSSLVNASASSMFEEELRCAVSTNCGYSISAWFWTWLSASYCDTNDSVWRTTSYATNRGKFAVTVPTSGWVFASGSFTEMTNHTGRLLSVLRYVVQSNANPSGQLKVTINDLAVGTIESSGMDGTLHDLYLTGWARTGDVLRVGYDAFPAMDGMTNPLLQLVCAAGLVNTSYYGRAADMHGQPTTFDYPTEPRQVATAQYVDDLVSAALASANAETHSRTEATDFNNHLVRLGPRVDTFAVSNSYVVKIGGQTVVEVDGDGAAVIPEIRAFSVSVGETATMSVWSYSGGATNLIPEVSSNLLTWTRLSAAAILSATNVDAYTAQIVFTNEADRMMFVRLVDVSGGDGDPVVRIVGGVDINGDTRTAWPTGTGEGISATDATGIVYAVIGAAPVSAFSNVTFGATATVMCATGTWYDVATRTAYTTSCPSGAGSGTGMTNSLAWTMVDTNASGTMTFDFRLGSVLKYRMAPGGPAVTNQLFLVDDTNKVSSARVSIYTTTNSFTWDTNIVRFVPNTIPIVPANTNNAYYMEAHAGLVTIVYLRSEP